MSDGGVVILRLKAEESHKHSSSIICDSSLTAFVQNDRVRVLWRNNGCFVKHPYAGGIFHLKASHTCRGGG